MKRNNVAKRFGVASVCLATAFSAFSGITSQTSNVALADGEIAVTDFVYTTAETVTAQKEEKTKADGSTTATGLRFSSDAAYKGMFRTVFTGDTTLNFKFPEGDAMPAASYTGSYYGDFTIRIADVDDDSNYFDIVYAAIAHNKDTAKPYTNVYLKYNGMTRASKYNGAEWYSSEQPANYCGAYPTFQSFIPNKNFDGNIMSSLTLDWDENGVLSVKKHGATSASGEINVLAAFDGTYTEEKGNGFVNLSSWGLPKLEDFKDGYTISFSSNITADIAGNAVEDHGTDVLFTTISTNDGAKTYDLSGATVATDDSMTNFDNTFGVLTTQEATAGKVFLGWKNVATNKLYPANSIVKKSDNYAALIISYDTMNGANVRIDTKGGESGIRFMTTFDKDEYAAVEQYITERGTLVAVTSALDGSKDFTIENYQAEINADGKVKKVKNTKNVFDYEAQDGTIYKAYSMAIVFSDVSADYYTIAYSARGYLVVTYADGTTATIYTDYNVTDNSRSIAQTAYNLTTVGKAEYDTYTTDQQTIVDTYAGYYNAN